MRISVNIRRVLDHVGLLHQQQREAEALINCLIALRKQAAETGIPDIGLVERQLRTAQNQAVNIRRRIVLLESVSEYLIELTRTVGSILIDAQDMAHTAGS